MSLELATTEAPRVRPSLAWPPWAVSIVVAIGFFLAACLGLALLDKAGVAVFWPAAGIASGVMVAFGPAVRWPVIIGVVAATFAANLLGDRNLASTVFFAVANAVGPLVVSGLIQRWNDGPFELNELRRVFELFGATIAAACVSGIIGTLGFVLFHASGVSVAKIWYQWVASESLGTITVAPLMLGSRRSCARRRHGARRRKQRLRLRSWRRSACCGSICLTSPGRSNWRLLRSVRCSCGLPRVYARPSRRSQRSCARS